MPTYRKSFLTSFGHCIAERSKKSKESAKNLKAHIWNIWIYISQTLRPFTNPLLIFTRTTQWVCGRWHLLALNSLQSIISILSFYPSAAILILSVEEQLSAAGIEPMTFQPGANHGPPRLLFLNGPNGKHADNWTIFLFSSLQHEVQLHVRIYISLLPLLREGARLELAHQLQEVRGGLLQGGPGQLRRKCRRRRQRRRLPTLCRFLHQGRRRKAGRGMKLNWFWCGSKCRTTEICLKAQA